MDASVMQRIMAHAVASAVTQQRPLRFTSRVDQDIPYDYDPNFAHVENTFIGIFPFLGRILKTMTMGTLLLGISVLTYAVFLQAAMPSLSAAQPLFFDYTGAPTPSFHAKTTSHSGSRASSFYGKSSTPSSKEPWAVVDLFAKHTSWDALQMEVLPKPVASERLLKSKHPHFIEVVLTLPESNVNREAGIFGVVTELYSHNGTQLAVSRRSTRFPHQSLWITAVRQFVCLIPLLIGAIEEARTVVVPSFRHYVESSAHPLQYVLIRIVPPATFTQRQQPMVEVVRGDLLIGKELNAFQEMLKVWFYTCYSTGTLLFAGFYVMVWSILRIIWQEVRRSYFWENMDLGDLDLSVAEDGDDVFQDFEAEREPFAEDSDSPPGVSREPDNIGEDGEEPWEDLYFPAAMDAMDDDSEPVPDAPPSSSAL